LVKEGGVIFTCPVPKRLGILCLVFQRDSAWVQVFGDDRLTAAPLNRLMHHSHIIEMASESYQFRQRMEQDVKEGDGFFLN
jgi:DNA replication protein DnaC